MPLIRSSLVVGLLVILTSGASADDKQKFQTKFEKDKPFHQKLVTKVEQNLKVQGGTDITLKHEQTFYFKWTPVTVEAEKAVVKQTIEGLKFTLDISGQSLVYDSTAPNEGGVNPGLSDFFKGLVGSEFTVTFGKNGEVEKVEGAEELIKKLGGVNQAMESVLKKVLSEDALKAMTDPACGMTPSSEQIVGGTWQKPSVLNLGPIGTYDRVMSYKYEGRDSTTGRDKITVKPTVTYKPPTDGEGLPFRVKGGTLQTKEAKEGVIIYDPKVSRVASARFNVIMEGTLDVSINNSDTKLTLYQDQKTELDCADSSFLPGAKKEEKKDAPKEAPKDAPKETPKDTPKETPKDAPKEAPKDAPKEAPKH